MKRKLLLISSMIFTLLTSCSAKANDGVSVLSGGQSIGSVQETTKREVPEGAITDESGDFIYTGKLQPVGDDENGYIQVPLGYVPFQDEDVEGLTQYSDVTGTNIFTLDYYEGVSYETAAENMRYYFAERENIEGLSGAVVTVGGYNARQLYCHFTDDNIFLVVWLIEDPDNTDSCYYLAIEFDSAHQDIMACSSTFQTVNDYHKTHKE